MAGSSEGSKSGSGNGLLRDILVLVVIMLILCAWFQSDPLGFEAIMAQIGLERQVD